MRSTLIDSAEPDALLGDKAYDADSLIDILNQRQITPVIPSKANRKVQRNCDFALYCERNRAGPANLHRTISGVSA